MKNSVVSLLAIALGASASSCATSPPKIDYAVEGKDFSVSWREDVSRERFDVILTSTSKRRLCMSLPSWPNDVGKVSGGGDLAAIKGDNGTIASIETEFPYCIGPDCEIRIAPGASINGYIDYGAFGEKSVVEGLKNRSLDFRPNPYFCLAKG
ncbi:MULTISPECIES: hypothetical protein [unclassified Caulobacter]|uniref:hypothetical protein n=1 Tax=unclassified Caulobacter TaxID=2648921 RepID=UPI0011B66B13|nr:MULTISPECIES: hypothetical protein [unclassified Caulobacter]